MASIKQLTGLDRVFLVFISIINMLTGIYICGPWHIDEIADQKHFMYQLFYYQPLISLYGIVLVVASATLGLIVMSKVYCFWYTFAITALLKTIFMLKLFSFVGLLISMESWRPPTYLYHLPMLVILGGYWIWLTIDGGDIK